MGVKCHYFRILYSWYEKNYIMETVEIFISFHWAYNLILVM